MSRQNHFSSNNQDGLWGNNGSNYTFRSTPTGSGNWNSGGRVVGTGNLDNAPKFGDYGGDRGGFLNTGVISNIGYGGRSNADYIGRNGDSGDNGLYGGNGTAQESKVRVSPYRGNIMAGIIKPPVGPRVPGQIVRRQTDLKSPIPSYIAPSNYGPGNPRPMFPSSPQAPRPLSDYGPGTNHGGFRPYLGALTNTRGINPSKGTPRGINPMTQEPIGGSQYQSMWGRGTPYYENNQAGMYNGSIPFFAPQTPQAKQFHDRLPGEYTSGGGGGGGGGKGW